MKLDSPEKLAHVLYLQMLGLFIEVGWFHHDKILDTDVIDFIQAAYAKQKWRKLFKLMIHSVQSALQRLHGRRVWFMYVVWSASNCYCNDMYSGWKSEAVSGVECHLCYNQEISNLPEKKCFIFLILLCWSMYTQFVIKQCACVASHGINCWTSCLILVMFLACNNRQWHRAKV